jgi:glucosamine 6-phosphate synthetase-like amidotransferase/phosphosugar isomerase protein
MTNAEHLLSIAKAGNELAAEGTSASATDLLRLLHLLECVLDQGRGLASQEARPEINREMERLRGRISSMVDALDAAEARQLFADLGAGVAARGQDTVRG